MRVDHLLLADAATGADGKIYIHGGGITRISPPGVPFILPQLAVVIRLLVDEDEPDRPQQLVVRLTDPAGDLVLPPAMVEVNAAEVEGLKSWTPETASGWAVDEERALNVMLTIAGIPLTREGTHRLSLSIDDDEVRTMSLPVLVPGIS